ncbi:MAG: hypothetical protein ACRETA_04495 [Gammaproteobacteria bacterium]
MPKKVERRLWKEAKEKFPGDEEKQKAYVYGTMNKLGLLSHHHGKEQKSG